MARLLLLAIALGLVAGCSAIVPAPEPEGIPIVITNDDDEAATIEVRQSLPDYQGEVSILEPFDLEPGASTTLRLPPTPNIDDDGWFMVTGVLALPPSAFDLSQEERR